MKNQLLVLVFMIGLGSLYAQQLSTEKQKPTFYKQGEWMVSVSPNIGWAKRIRFGGTQLTSGGLAVNSRLTAGRFLVDKWFVGTSLHYNGIVFSDLNNADFTSGLLTRYYGSRKALSPFVEANAGYYHSIFLGPEFIKIPRQGVYAGVRVGLAYRAGNLSFDASWGREWRSETVGIPDWNRTPMRLGINFHF